MFWCEEDCRSKAGIGRTLGCEWEGVLLLQGSELQYSYTCMTSLTRDAAALHETTV